MNDVGDWRLRVYDGRIVTVEVVRSGSGFAAQTRAVSGPPRRARGKNPRRAILAYARRWMGLTADQIEETAEPGQKFRAEAEADVEVARKECERAYNFERDALTALGADDAKLRMLARMVTTGNLSAAGVMAEDILSDDPPTILTEMRESTTGRAGINGWPVQVLADSLGEEILRVGAENFVEWSIRFCVDGEDLDFVLRVERVSGKTPAMLVDEARAEVAVLRAEMDALRGKGGES